MLAIVILSMGLIAGMVGFVAANNASVNSYKNQRTDRYLADGSLKSAINWLKLNPQTGRNPDVFPDDPDCAYRLDSVTVTCQPTTGPTGSGVPVDTGKTPPNAILTVGQRYGEAALYSPCTGSTNDRTVGEAREVGVQLDPITLGGSAPYVCVAGTGGIGAVKVEGNIRSNAPIRVRSGTLEVVGSGDTIEAGVSPLYDQAPCSAGINNCSALATVRSRTSPASGDPKSPWDPGEYLLTDPGLDSGTGSQWRQGTVNWSAPMVSINGGTPVALTTSTSLSACTNSSTDLVRFYPGFYSSAAALNRIFNDTESGKTCNRGVYWFGPAADAAGTVNTSPLTDTAQQGVYLFDFRDAGTGTDGSGRACAYFNNTNYPHRWCLKAAVSSGGPLVVGGTPLGWDPATLVGAPDGSTTRTVSLGAAGTIDTDGSWTWENPSLAQTLDSAYTKYDPFIFSYNRTIILKNFASKPAAVAPTGTITITVRHREHRSLRLDNPKVVIGSNDRGNPLNCGEITVPKSKDSADMGAPDTPRTDVISTDSALSTVALTPAQVTALRGCFINADRIANLTLKWKVTGDGANLGNFGLGNHPGTTGAPKLYLDGMNVDVDVPTGGWFAPGVAMPATYCDKTRAGVQFILGGDSSIHAGNAAMQLCAGPAPDHPQDYQQIAIWGQPTNYRTVLNGSNQEETRVGRLPGRIGSSSLFPTTVTKVGDNCGTCTPSSKFELGERALVPYNPYTDPANPTTPVTADVNMGCCFYHDITMRFNDFGKVRTYQSGLCQPSTDICYDAATQTIERVEMKVAYYSDCGGLIFCGSSSGRQSFELRDAADSEGSKYCYRDDSFPATVQLVWYSVDISSCMDLGATDPAAKINDLAVRFWMKCKACTNNRKKLKGLELIVTIGPKNASSKSVTPAGGCITSPTGYGSGVGDYNFPTTYAGADAKYTDPAKGRDCALISGGRVSIQGTIFAPDAALEVYDGDALYPFATRGLVSRTLRVRKYAPRSGYAGSMVTNKLSTDVADRDVTLTACSRASATDSSPCGSVTGDRVLASARVKFNAGSNTPIVLAWDERR